MAFVPWKDRVTSTPHRYKLTEVSADTYDLTAVPGAIGEVGTPVNAENLNKLIQRDGDDIKDTVTTFTEASTRENIATGEKTSTIFGKIKKWFADLKQHAFNDLATVQGTETDKAPTNKLLQESSYVAIYRSIDDPRLTAWFDAQSPAITPSNATPVEIASAMVNNSILIMPTTSSEYPNLHPADVSVSGKLVIERTNTYSVEFRFNGKAVNGTTVYFRRGVVRIFDTSNQWSGWKVDLTSDNISTVMPLSSAAASNDKALSEKVVYDEFGKRTAYDKIIRTQAEFDALIASPTWLGAESVALVGQFTLSTANNSGIKVPDTVKQIHGFNRAKITVTNFLYNVTTAKGGLWYNTRPTTNEYSIRDLEVDCTGTGTGAVGTGYGFRECTNLTNCTGTGTGTGAGGIGYGFRGCTNLTNCTGTGTVTGTVGTGYGFRECTNLTNCTGTGTGTGAVGTGYGFYDITYASNCKDGGSSTNMWGGTNKNIDLDTCCKTPVTADNTTLNT